MRFWAPQRKSTHRIPSAQTTIPRLGVPGQRRRVRSILNPGNNPDRLQLQPRQGPLEDRHEQEADVATVQEAWMPEPQPTPISASDATPIQARSVLHEFERAPGHPLDVPPRDFKELRFGSALDHVRVHADAKAVASTRVPNSRAFTAGSRMVFGKGNDQPGNESGQQHSNRSASRTTDGRPMRPRPADHLSRTPSRRIQRDPLPFPRLESVDETVRRLIAELNEHLDQGRVEEARALVPDIQGYIESDVLAWDYADDAAQAFLRLGMVDAGVGALQAGRAARFGSHGRYAYSLQAVEMLFDAGNRFMQADDHDQAWEAYEAVFNWLENQELSRGALGFGEEPTETVRQWYHRIITALFSIPSRLRAQGNQEEAERYLTSTRDLVIGSEATHRYGEDSARAFIEAGRAEDAFAVLRHAETEFPDSNPLIAYSEGAITFLVGSGEQAVSNQNWDMARQVFIEALRWVDEHSADLGAAFYNLGNERNVVARSVDRIMRGLIAIAIHYQQEAIRAFETNAQDAPQRLQTARAEIERIRRLVPERLNNRVIIAEIEQRSPASDTATYRDAFAPGRELEVTRYGGQEDFEDRLLAIERILDTLTRQTGAIEQFYATDAAIVTQFESRHGHRPDIHSIQDRRLFWELKYAHLLTAGRSRQEALQALIDSIGDYLQAFTFHTQYDIPDTFEHALTTDFPRTAANQALLDCGIFAMRTAYELSLIRDTAQIDFHYVSIPHHVYLGLIDRGNAFGWALSNNRFRVIGSNIATVGIATAVADEFNIIPSDVEAHQIASFSESGLRSEFRDAGRGINLPPNYRSLDAAARRGARRRRRDLSERYTRLVHEVREQTVYLRALLNILRDEYDALPEAPTETFENSAEERILILYRQYVALSRDVDSYIADAVDVLGPRVGQMSSSLSFYFINMDLAMDYAVHRLGREDLAGDDYIREPLYERIERRFGFQYRNVQRDYRGTPPPWEAARWERD